MRSLATIALLVPLAAATAGCMDTHSVKPPRKPDPEAKVDIGPIVDDESGVDLGPVVAARMRERKLGDARYVGAPGENPYVSGRIKVERGEAGVASANWGGITLLTTGLTSVLIGSILLGLTAGEKNADGVKNVGTGLLVLGIGGTAGGIALLFQPSRYREATLTADLDIRRGGTLTTVQAKDNTTIHHDYHKDEQAGAPLLDGVANAICKETGQ